MVPAAALAAEATGDPLERRPVICRATMVPAEAAAAPIAAFPARSHRLVVARGRALIRIEDDGPGIPADQIEAMMQPFTRGEPSRNSATGGAGLGLTLARAIAEQHGGALTLANRLDAQGRVVGLTATLSLPLA